MSSLILILTDRYPGCQMASQWYYHGRDQDLAGTAHRAPKYVLPLMVQYC